METSPTRAALPAAIAVRKKDSALTVSLKNYVLLSSEAINLDDANRVKLQAVMNQDPLALIEYWAVDPDYDGRLFRSVWQDYRGNTANDGDALSVISVAVLTCPAWPHAPGLRAGGGRVRLRVRGGGQRGRSGRMNRGRTDLLSLSSLRRRVGQAPQRPPQPEQDGPRPEPPTHVCWLATVRSRRPSIAWA